MKRIFILSVLMLCGLLLQAQGAGSFFRQKQTQRKYYIQQIAALRWYLGYIKEGYQITGAGLGSVQSSKKTEQDLHHQYQQSLMQVNSHIGQSAVVKEIYKVAATIRQTFRNTIQQLEANQAVPSLELKYTRDVFLRLDNDLSLDLEELSMIVNPGKLQLTDDERWKRVKAVQSAVENKYAFTLSFTRKALFVAQQRERQLRDIRRMKKIHHIKE